MNTLLIVLLLAIVMSYTYLAIATSKQHYNYTKALSNLTAVHRSIVEDYIDLVIVEKKLDIKTARATYRLVKKDGRVVLQYHNYAKQISIELNDSLFKYIIYVTGINGKR